MKLEDTNFLNYKLVIGDFDIPLAVQINGEIAFKLYDEVRVTADSNGYVGRGINQEGFGRIVCICRDETDYFFEVLMEDGQYGRLKSSRMTKI